jgi:hypothetical protein
MEVSGQIHVPAALLAEKVTPPGNNRGLGGPKADLEAVGRDKFLVVPGIET